jgi:hypothetical protein
MSAPPVSPISKLAQIDRRWIIAAVVGVLALVVLGLLFWMWKTDPEPMPTASPSVSPIELPEFPFPTAPPLNTLSVVPAETEAPWTSTTIFNVTQKPTPIRATPRTTRQGTTRRPSTPFVTRSTTSRAPVGGGPLPITQSQWDAVTQGNADREVDPKDRPYFSLANLQAAALKFPELYDGDLETNRRVLATLLANVQQETEFVVTEERACKNNVCTRYGGDFTTADGCNGNTPRCYYHGR